VTACWWCRCAPPTSRASPVAAPCRVAATDTSPPFGRRCLLVRASLRRRRVRERLCAVWRRPTRVGCLSARASHLCGRVRARLRAVWRWPTTPTPPRRGRLSVRASLRRGRVRERLRAVWRRPTTPVFLRLGVDACWCAPPTIAGESVNGSAWCGGDRLLPQFRRGRLSARASFLRRGWVFGSIGKGPG
jgi:hypothetical protein